MFDCLHENCEKEIKKLEADLANLRKAVERVAERADEKALKLLSQPRMSDTDHAVYDAYMECVTRLEKLAKGE